MRAVDAEHPPTGRSWLGLLWRTGMRLTWHSAPAMTKESQLGRKHKNKKEGSQGPRGSVRLPLRALFGRHRENEGPRRPPAPAAALRGVRTCQERPGPGDPPRGKGRPGPGPGPSASAPAPPQEQEPGPEVSARRRQARQGPSRGSRGVRGGRGAQPPPRRARRASPRRARRRPHLPRALPQPRPAASPTWRPRRASCTSQRDPAPLGTGSAVADGRRETLVGHRRRRRPVRRQAAHSEPVAQPVTGARAPRRRLSPTTTWRPRPPQEAGGRGGRRRAGQLTARPPARGRHRLPHPREREVGPGAAPHPQSPGAPDPAGLVPALLSPLGEALKPRAPQPFPGAAAAHLAPPPRGDMLRLGGAFPATAEPPRFRGRPSLVGRMPVAPHMGLSPEPSLPLRLTPLMREPGFSWKGDVRQEKEVILALVYGSGTVLRRTDHTRGSSIQHSSLSSIPYKKGQQGRGPPPLGRASTPNSHEQ